MYMKNIVYRIILLSLILFVLAACGSKTQEVPSSETAQSEAETETAPVEENTAEETPASEPVTLTFDPHVYENSNDDTYLNVLSFATNSSDKVVMATISCKAFDADGQIISMYDWIRDKSSEKWQTDLFIPAGVEDHPIAFTLPQGFRYNIKEDSYLPEIDHMEFEVLATQEMELEDLRAHFTPVEEKVNGNTISYFMSFDQEIADKYSSLYVNYALICYSGDEITGVCCRNDFPYASSSYSVADAVENRDSRLLAYHDVPNVPITEWKMYIGCVAGE